MTGYEVIHVSRPGFAKFAGRALLWSFFAATGLALLGTTQGYTSRIIEGQAADWARLFRAEAINWYVWALLAPFVVLIGSRIRETRASPLRAGLLYAAAALVFLAAHSLLEVTVALALGAIPVQLPFTTLLFARFSATIVANLVVFVSVALVFNALEHYRDVQARRLKESQLREQLAKAQLRALRVQLQPHFLFNTLHTASALMNRDVELARGVLTRLGDLLRAALAHGEAEEVALEEEMAFIEKYLDIQRTRFDGRLSVDIAVASEARTGLVPSLVLQPLVENAIRYAIEPRAAAGLIRIRAFRSGSDLCLEVTDNGPGISDDVLNSRGFGIGLTNTVARLQTLYQERHRLDFIRVLGGGLTVRLTIPYRSAAR